MRRVGEGLVLLPLFDELMVVESHELHVEDQRGIRWDHVLALLVLQSALLVAPLGVDRHLHALAQAHRPQHLLQSADGFAVANLKEQRALHLLDEGRGRAWKGVEGRKKGVEGRKKGVRRP